MSRLPVDRWQDLARRVVRFGESIYLKQWLHWLPLASEVPHLVRILPCRDHAAHAICIFMFHQNFYCMIHALFWANGRSRAQLDHNVGLITFILLQPL